MAQDGTTVLPQSMKDFVVHGDIWKLWDAAEYNTGSEVDKFKEACSFKAGKIFGTTNKCENVIFCLYNVSDKFIVPLGILKSISVEKKGTNEIFTLAFTEVSELKSFDNLEIKISKTNLSRIKYVYLDGNVEKRQSMMTKAKESMSKSLASSRQSMQRNSNAPISPEEQLVDETPEVQGQPIQKKSFFSRLGTGLKNAVNMSTKDAALDNTSTPLAIARPINPGNPGTNGGKRKTAHKSKNKKRKFSLRKK